ncbi:Genetic interactor of prohibitins 3, mitochondrial [Colletotrichum chlorophyti]|uniref:Genetic interactor of prohibitins 3, mitochondrial n=1 Tax=Colletotrichum chlorophyti TaxID=708187 RepID=A0A1Q8RXX5_9PEZI|nr:Genetic interactor of prohibitins 3, mitochondrial [Colletotrichum chlorophyti]
MHRTLPSRWLRSALSIGDRAALAEVPVYLCPTLSSASPRHTFAPTAVLPYRQRRCVHVDHEKLNFEAPPPPSPPTPETSAQPSISTKNLPLQCSGCGAMSQTTDAELPGYYNVNRKDVREFLQSEEDKEAQKDLREEDKIVEQALQNIGEEKLAELGLDPKALRYGEELDSDRAGSRPPSKRAPLCHRCHNLIHHRAGNPIFHPTVDTLRETIEESPFKNNHIYHIIDAADFPMSFMPKLHEVLEANIKHRNRRNRSGRYYKDRKFDISFVITRSDLLAPKKEQVDSLMPYFREVLRQSLGKFGQIVRLGNVRCVSAERGWWTKKLKEDIYERGGAGWFVGKVNVGKSKLFETVFPKGTTASITSRQPNDISLFATEEDGDGVHYVAGGPFEGDADRLDLSALLPPAREETNYPEMPTVSSLPGTTASPIRIPFGNGKGELIDLPGVARSNLEEYVKPEDRSSLIMEKRVKAEQNTLKPGQSLMLGGLIRISPATPDLIFLAYNFTPIPHHVTSDWKAEAFMAQTRESERVPTIASPGIGDKMKLAATLQLRYDVTKERAGPLTRKEVGKMKVEDLPWRVLAIDILIEGCGWVEIVAQVRSKNLFKGCAPLIEEAPAPEPEAEAASDPWAQMEKAAKDQAAPAKAKPAQAPKPAEPNWPVVEVYAPEGKFIGSRQPMNAWLLNKPKKKDIKARPRKSMKGAKKRAKAAKRELAAA